VRLNRALSRPTTAGRLLPSTLEWIRQCVQRASVSGARVVVVMHHNLVDHSELLHAGYTLNNSREVVTVFETLGLDVVLSGHLHIQHIARTEQGSAPLFEIVTSGLCLSPHQYGLLEWLPSGEIDYRTARVDIEGWARATGARKKELRMFAGFSAARFASRSRERTYASLASTGRSDRDRRTMAETMSLLNAHYFAGTTHRIAETVVASEGYRLWTAAEPSFLKRYVLSMIPQTPTDHTHLRIGSPR
jgi:hypothetical protein